MKLNKFFKFLGILLTFFLNNCSDYTENLGHGYYFLREGSPTNEIYCEKPEGGRVPATVIDFEYDVQFIIAKQKPDLPQSILYEKKYEYKYGPNEYYYWLIVKDEYLVLGPFNLAEFNEKRQMYKVPETLELKK